MSLSIVILLSGKGTNCQAILDAIADGLPATVNAVISDNPNAFGLKRAQNVDIPAICIDPKNFDDPNLFNQQLLATINHFEPELIVLAGFMRILSADIVNQYQNKIINIHPSLLPLYPGLNTHQRVLDDQATAHGVSIHWVTKDLDAGPLIAQAAFKVEESDDPESLQERAHELEHVMYPQVIQWLALQQALVEPHHT